MMSKQVMIKLMDSGYCLVSPQHVRMPNNPVSIIAGKVVVSWLWETNNAIIAVI